MPIPTLLTARSHGRVLAVITTLLLATVGHAEPAPATVMRLDACLELALKNNHRRPASQLAVAIAEAQHQQALSAYWPQATLKAAYQHLDEAPNFLFPAGYMGVPPQTITVPAGTAVINVPAGVLGPTAIQLPVDTPAQTITTTGQVFPIPAQDVKLMNPDSTTASVNLTWLLFDGGMRKGYREQAAGQVAALQAEARRTDLEIVDTVKRYYYGAILAAQIQQVGQDTLQRMEATLHLTQAMFNEGSSKVKKTDFLETKVMVESLRAMTATLEKNATIAQAALANAVGLPWNAGLRPAENELPASEFSASLDGLVGTAYQFNPDWAKVEAGLRALEGGVTTARSGYAPKIALIGELHQWWNGYDAGLATDRNKQGYSVGVGLELPLFDGFMTRHKIAEARARVAQLKEQQLLLKDGLGLQIKDVFLGLIATQKAFTATHDAMTAATESRDLNTRAYQNELVETEKMIRAQLMEALMTAQHLKARYDLLMFQSQLNLLVGKELLHQLNTK